MYLIRDITVVLIWANILSSIDLVKCQKGRKRDMMEDIQKTVTLIWTSIEKNEQKVSSIENSIALMSNRVERIVDSIEHNKLNDKLLEERLEKLEIKIRNIENALNDRIETITESVNQMTNDAKRMDSETDIKLRKLMNILSDTYELSKDVSILMKGRSTGYIGNGDNEGSEPIEEMQKKVLEQMSILETSLSQKVSNVERMVRDTGTALKTINLEMITIRDECQTQRKSSQQSDKRDSDFGSYYPSTKGDRNSNQCSNINITELKHEIEDQFERISVKVDNEFTLIDSKFQEYMTTCNTNTNGNGRSISQSGTAPVIVSSGSSVYMPTRKTIAPVEKSTGRTGCQHSSELLAPKDCYELNKSGANCDGVYIVYLMNTKLLRVYCDMTDNGGGWTVILRRGEFGPTRSHKISFEQDWNSYRDGFGNIESGEFWLGLNNIHQMTATRGHMLQVDLEAFDGDYISIIYDSFKISGEEDNYRLHLGNAIHSNTTIAQSFISHNTSQFSTYDRNNNVISKKDNCAEKLKGGWWFHNCHSALLTAPYFSKQSRKHVWQGMQWHSWKQMNHLKAAQMKIRPKD